MSDHLAINPVFTEDSNGDQYIEPYQNNLLTKSSLPLPELLSRIVAQEGPFSSLKESDFEAKSREEETRSDNEGNLEEQGIDKLEDDNNIEGIANGAQERESDGFTIDEFMKKKMQAISSLNTALNESSLSLDFISLLISSVRPGAGTSSMSPHLKQHVQVGSLSSSMIDKEKVKTESELTRDNKNTAAGRGWKLQSLVQTSSDLKSAAKRLGLEITKEKKYWDGMLDIVKSPEVIIPITGNQSRAAREIGIKYGYKDAGSSYYDQGIGLLRKHKKNGQLYFEKRQLFPQVQSVENGGKDDDRRIVIVKLYKPMRTKDSEYEQVLVGTSTISSRISTFINESTTSVLSDIESARYFVFEDELFYQLLKEAATLTALQVKVESDKIMIELHHMTLQILQVSAKEAVSKSTNNNSSTKSTADDKAKYNRMANEILLFFHLMLCSQHRHNLHRMRLPPPSLSKQQLLLKQISDRSIVVLIRPLISYQKHHRTLRKLIWYIRNILLESERNDSEAVDEIMKVNFKLRKFCNDPNQLTSCTRSKRLIKDNPFIRCLISPLSIMQLKYKNRMRVQIELSTNLAAAFSNIHVKVDTKSHFEDGTNLDELSYDTNQLDATFNDPTEFEDRLRWVICHS